MSINIPDLEKVLFGAFQLNILTEIVEERKKMKNPGGGRRTDLARELTPV